MMNVVSAGHGVILIFTQCRRIRDFIINKDDTYRAEMICYESEKIDGTDISAEVTINARFDGAELHEYQ